MNINELQVKLIEILDNKAVLEGKLQLSITQVREILYNMIVKRMMEVELRTREIDILPIDKQ